MIIVWKSWLWGNCSFCYFTWAQSDTAIRFHLQCFGKAIILVQSKLIKEIYVLFPFALPKRRVSLEVGEIGSLMSLKLCHHNYIQLTIQLICNYNAKNFLISNNNSVNNDKRWATVELKACKLIFCSVEFQSRLAGATRYSRACIIYIVYVRIYIRTKKSVFHWEFCLSW